MDLYVILGLERAATSRDVQRAYTRVARRYHPDLNPGDDEAAAFFRRATEAYETLSDPERRRAYDTGESSRPAAAQVAEVEFCGFDFSSPASGASATFTDLFDQPGEGGDRRPGAEERGSDVFGRVSLGFREALKGSERQFSITRLETCGACGGTGIRRGPEQRCARCQGGGSMVWRRGHMLFSRPCSPCGGTGVHHQRPCNACQAEGRVTTTAEISIQVPAGVADGARMRIPRQGNAGLNGGPPGDLYITAAVAPHRVLRRQGDDLLLDLPVAVHEAALGATVDVPTIDGRAGLRIPAGTPSGRRLRLKGRGVRSPRTGQPGDMIVTVTLVVPVASDDRSRTLLRELGGLQQGDIRRDLFVE